MSNQKVKRKNLWNKLSNIKRQDEWIKAIETLGFIVKPGKGSHYVARNDKFPDKDIRSLVATIQKDIRCDVSQSIFKNILDKGIEEDAIWKALKLLK